MHLPARPPRLAEIWSSSEKNSLDALRRLHSIEEAAPGGRYLHWDKLRRLRPPEGFSSGEWWSAVKLARQGLLRPIGLNDREGRPFRFALADPVLQLVHHLDRAAAGRGDVPAAIKNPETRDRYLFASLTEEAITSSMLEGAETTREVAREMIRSGRPPRDRSERMVLNSYRAMQDLRELRGKPLTPERVLALHRVLTEGTLDEAAGQGRLLRGDEEIVVADAEGNVLHRPPDARELPDRLRRMCDFANGLPEGPFLYPIARAVLLHFWLAYDHPFVDGNGRTARALFYWSMLRSGYPLAEFVSISEVIRRQPARYPRSFLYTETDENDLTYFLLEQLRVLRLAFERLDRFVARKAAELNFLERLLRRSDRFNHRQLALLAHAIRHLDREFTIRSHGTSHNVTYQTARTDLLGLARAGFLLQRKAGKRFVFRSPPDLERRLRSGK